MREVLKRTDYNKTKTAQLLQVDRKTLYNKMKALYIEDEE
ncbi:MAG: helix-turn-helix domain-containing protein [Fulvivirga sp.]